MKRQVHSFGERCFAFALAFCMVLGMMPGQVLAEDTAVATVGSVVISLPSGVTATAMAPGDVELSAKALDGDGDEVSSGVTYIWSMTGSTTGFGLNNANSATPTLTTPSSFDDDTTITLKVTCSVTDETDVTQEQVLVFLKTVVETPTYTLKVTTTSISVEEGSTSSITAELDSTGADSTESIQYKSDDTSVATVSSSGVVTGVKAGTANITVSHAEAEDDVKIPVTVTAKKEDTSGGTEDGNTEDDAQDNTAVTVTGIGFTSSSSSSGTADGGSTVMSTTSTLKTMELTAQVSFSDSTYSMSTTEMNAITWTLSNSGIVNMSSTGITRTFTALAAGETTLTISYQGFDITHRIVVSGLTVMESSLDLSTNSHLTLDMVLYGATTTVTAKATNSTLVTVGSATYDKSAGTASVELTTNNTTGAGSVQLIVDDGNMVEVSIQVTEAVAENIVPSYNVNTITPLKFSDLLSEFNARGQAIHEEDVYSLSSISVPTEQGTLYIGYINEANPGAGLASSKTYYFDISPSVLNIVFIPKDTYTGTTATVSYTATTTGGNTFSGQILVNLAPIDDVVLETTPQEAIGLSSYAFAQAASSSGKVIDYIVFALPDENKALLYYDYKSADNYHHLIVPGEQFSEDDIDKITVIPSPGYYGTLEIPYIITAKDGTTLPGTTTVEVAAYEASGPVMYNTISGQYITLITSDFHSNVRAITGFNMSYITFTLPDPAIGTLYVDYNDISDYGAKVSENTAYYATSRDPEISDVAFVPAAGYTGSAKISFVGYDTQGTSYLGTLEVNVGTQTLGDITYTCSANSYVPFYEGDFNRFSLNQTGANVEFITFPELPSVAQGTLMLGKTSYQPGVAVAVDYEYKYTDTPFIGDLSFSAATSYSGIVTIPFEGRSVAGEEFAGTVTVMVSNQNLVKIPYTASYYKPATFDSIDFDHYAYERTGTELDYVRFELPLTTVGTLYYNYTSQEDFSSLVNASNNYYVNQSHFLNSVSFVPHKDFQGTAEVKFTGWGTNGQSFSGVLSIYVADGGDPLTYYMYTGDYLYLNSVALNEYCLEELGSSLNYITIGSPSTAQGRLYEDYSIYDNTHTATSSSTRYYKSQSSYISNVAFVSTDGYLGSVQLPFTAYAVNGEKCTGTVNIVVRSSTASDSVYYYSSFSPIQVDEKDIYNVWGSEDIDYIQIHNIPTEKQGKLYYENKLTSYATTNLKYYTSDSSEGPYISQMIFAPRAGFSGTMVLTYTATTVSGRTFSGDICVIVTTGQASLYFNDMSNHLWATSSADYLYLTSVSTGTGMGGFSPAEDISRGDFALMLCNAFRFSGTATTAFSDVGVLDYYYSAIHTLRALGITTGYENKFKPEESISRQDAVVMLSKAMEIANKDVKSATTAVLEQYTDYEQIANYAKTDFALMVHTGIVSGSYGKLSPTANITRAEMAVMLHQAMTC